MKTTMVLSLLVVLVSCQKEIANKTTAASAEAGALSTQNHYEIIGIDESQWVPCFNEWVVLTGDLKYSIKYDTIGNNVHYHENWNESITGVGQTSGLKCTGELHTMYEGWINNYQQVDYTIPIAIAVAHLKLNRQGGGSVTIRQDFVMNSPDGVTRVPHLTDVVECN